MLAHLHQLRATEDEGVLVGAYIKYIRLVG